MISTDLNVAALPMAINWLNTTENMRIIEETAASLHADTDLLILPETCTTGFPAGLSRERILEISDTNNGPTIEKIKEISKKHNIAICGSFVARDANQLFNRIFFIEPNGDATFADKKHLFSMAGEHHTFQPGNRRLAIRYRGWNIAVIACYDVRFPVWCRNRNNEYDLLIAVANWPQARVDAWRKLLYARAIENEAYTIGVNCTGVDHNNYQYDGTTLMLDFKGKEINTPINNIQYTRLSKNKLQEFRTKFPAWQDADDFTIN